MNKAKRIYVLLGVLVVACVITVFISRHEEQKELIKNSDEIVLAIDTDTVTSLSWEYEENSFAFHKDEVWLYDVDEAFPVDEEVITGLLEQFQEFGVSFVIEEVEDYAQYGLDEPVCTIKMTADEKEYTILLGAFSTMDSQRYVSIGDGKVYLVSHDPLDEYEIELKDMILHDEIPGLSETTKISFSGQENYEIGYEEESVNTYCKEDVYFTEGKPLDSTLVGDYLDTISDLALSEYVSYNVSEEELSEFGLNDPDLTISVEYPVVNEEEETVTETFVLHLGRNQEELAEALKSEDENAEYSVTAYARVGESQIVYQITSLNYANLTKNAYDDLRHKEVLTASFDDIYQIDILLEENQYTISSEIKDEEKIWHYDSEEELDISTLKNAINSIEATTFTTEEPAEKEEISLTVYLDSEKYPEIHVGLYRYDGSDCIAVLDGEPFALVSRSSVVDLVEAVNKIILN